MIGAGSPIVERRITIKERIEPSRGRARLVITEHWKDADGFCGSAQKKWVYRVRVIKRQSEKFVGNEIENVMKHFHDAPTESVRGRSKKYTMKSHHFIEHHHTLFCVTYMHEVIIRVGV